MIPKCFTEQGWYWAFKKKQWIVGMALTVWGGLPLPHTALALRFSHQTSVILKSGWLGQKKKNRNPFKNGKVSCLTESAQLKAQPDNYNVDSSTSYCLLNIWTQIQIEALKSYIGVWCTLKFFTDVQHRLQIREIMGLNLTIMSA